MGLNEDYYEGMRARCRLRNKIISCMNFIYLWCCLKNTFQFKVLMSLFVTYFSYDFKCDDKFLYLFPLRQHPLLRKQLLSAKGGGRLT